MRDKLPVYIENRELPKDKFNTDNNNNKSYGYVSILYLSSIMITVISVLTIIFFRR